MTDGSDGGGGGDSGWELPPMAGEPVAPEPVAPEPVAPEFAAPPPQQADVALREAAGVAPMSVSRPPTARDPDDAVPRPRRRATALWALAIVAALAIGALAFLGRVNAGSYAIACAPDEIVAEQGRGFPPWGTRALSGVEWKAIAIPPNAECRPRETDSADELAGWYLDALVDRAGAELATHDPARVEIAAAELDQALLLARAPERRDQRNDIARLQGDVEYWRASAKLTAAQAALLDAARQFDAAAAKRPRHVADASAWSAFVRKVADQLRGGPTGAASAQTAQPLAQATPTAAATGDDRPPAPPGVALPVEPPAAATEAPTASGSAAIDAGVPGGGVLL